MSEIELSVHAIVMEGLNSGAAAAAVAESYAQAAGWLAGIAAALLVVFLSRRLTVGSHDDPDNPDGSGAASGGAPPDARYASEGKPVGSRHVVQALFFAMSALAICAFLYGSILDDAVAPGRLAIEMMFYGAALGTSVLALFYAVTLMMLEHLVTRTAARYAYWVLVIVGPGVVIRYLAGAAYEGWRLGTPSGSAWDSPLRLGTAIAVLVPLLMLGVIHRARIRRALGWVREGETLNYQTTALAHVSKIDGVLRCVFGRPLGWARNRLRERPVAPAVTALVLAALAALGSSFIAPLDREHVPGPWVSWVALATGAVAITYFAFATFSVLAERVGEQPRLPVWNESVATSLTQSSR